MAQKLTTSQIAPIRKLIMAKQGGLCAVCKINIINTGKLPALDHDHDCGHVRGVLCANCNGLEGKISNLAVRGKRNFTYVEWLERLIAYLKHHSQDRTGLIHPTHLTPDEQRLKRNAKAVKARAAKKASPS
jgi:hypothetical protein